MQGKGFIFYPPYESIIANGCHSCLTICLNRFWNRVVQDQELHNSLESFLNQGPHDYDLLVPESDIEVEHVVTALARRVFIVFIRMATYKESGV